MAVTLQPPALCIQDSLVEWRGWGWGDQPHNTKETSIFQRQLPLASNCVFNCHETIQNFQLRAIRLPFASQPEQGGVIILKASDMAVLWAGSPNYLFA